LFASGKKEETETKTQNDEWVLCVTDFNVSSVPEDKLSVSSVITKKVVDRIKIISYRTRISAEYAYYEGYAWSRKRSDAAKALSAKLEERSAQIFRGDASWKYKQNLEKIDAEIETLKLALEDVEKEAPSINKQPEFKLTSGNLSGSFPASPVAGGEYKFCQNQKADACLQGTIMDFHGRFYVSIKLYTVYTRSFVYEDSVIFSVEDMESAMDEITGKLLMVISGNKPAAIVVKAEPDNALVLINKSFSGKGNTGIIEQPPGKLTITASAPDYESMTLETELSAGELTEINLKLKQIEFGDVNLSGFSQGGNFYHGALYLGESPLTLHVPLNQMEYVELETDDNKKGTAVFYTPENNDYAYSLSLNTRTILPKGRVDRARTWYYWAWGGTWLTGIFAWITYNTYNSMDAAIRYNYDKNNEVNAKFHSNYTKMYYISMGAVIAVCAAVAYEIFHIGRYVYISNQGTTPVIKTSRD